MTRLLLSMEVLLDFKGLFFWQMCKTLSILLLMHCVVQVSVGCMTLAPWAVL